MSRALAINKKARFDYTLGECFEAGLVLKGWEIKALRAKRVQLRDCHVIFKNGEAFLLGSVINPLPSASTHSELEPDRTRKLLLHSREINQIRNTVERKGLTCVATRFVWCRGRVKCEISIAQGKKSHDKRDDVKKRDWNKLQARILKQGATQ